MRFINWWIDRIAISGLVVASGLLWLVAGILLLSLVFNFQPYITYGNHGSTIGITEYSKGIPVTVDISASIPDTSIFETRADGSTRVKHIGRHYFWSDSYADSTVLHADTALTEYDLDHGQNEHPGLQVTGLGFGNGTAYLQTSFRSQKMILTLPSLLKYAVLAYCAWQLAMLLSYIQSGEAFTIRNSRRLAKTGWALTGLYLSMLIYEIWVIPFRYLSISSPASPAWNAPFRINASYENNIGITWLIAGCIILILAKAFRKGSGLQQEQDLTV